MTEPASGLKDFHLTNVEFLRLLAYKQERMKSADPGLKKVLERECAILEAFYDTCLAIVTTGDLNHHAARLDAVHEHVKAVILQGELTNLYNTVYQRDRPLAFELIRSSDIPTRKELEASVILCNSDLSDVVG